MEQLKMYDMNRTYGKLRRRINHKLVKAGIEFSYSTLFNGYQWHFKCYPDGDAVIHFGSYGNYKGHVETMGFPWDEGDVTEMTPDELVDWLLEL